MRTVYYEEDILSQSSVRLWFNSYGSVRRWSRAYGKFDISPDFKSNPCRGDLSHLSISSRAIAAVPSYSPNVTLSVQMELDFLPFTIRHDLQ